MRGGLGGKLAPGEKKRLKRGRLLAKRAARAEDRGFDLGRVNQRIIEFVISDGDIMVCALLPPQVTCLHTPLTVTSLDGFKGPSRDPSVSIHRSICDRLYQQ